MSLTITYCCRNDCMKLFLTMFNISAANRSLTAAVDNAAAVVDLSDQPVQPITVTAEETMVLFTHTILLFLFFPYTY